MALSITGSNNSNPASQASTQSPQTSAGSGAPAAAPSSKVQPGTASNLLTHTNNGGGGVALANTSLSVVSLNTSAQTVSKPTAKPVSTPHHLNPVLVIMAIGLFMLAMVFSWVIARSAKNTTH